MTVVKAECITRIVHQKFKVITENIVPIENVDFLTSY